MSKPIISESGVQQNNDNDAVPKHPLHTFFLTDHMDLSKKHKVCVKEFGFVGLRKICVPTDKRKEGM